MQNIIEFINERLRLNTDSKIAKPKLPKQKKQRVITKEVYYYACYLDKVNEIFHCYSLGEYPKSSIGRKEAIQDAVAYGHPIKDNSKGKYKGVLNIDQIHRYPLPNNYTQQFY